MPPLLPPSSYSHHCAVVSSHSFLVLALLLGWKGEDLLFVAGMVGQYLASVAIWAMHPLPRPVLWLDRALAAWNTCSLFLLFASRSVPLLHLLVPLLSALSFKAEDSLYSTPPRRCTPHYLLWHGSLLFHIGTILLCGSPLPPVVVAYLHVPLWKTTLALLMAPAVNDPQPVTRQAIDGSGNVIAETQTVDESLDTDVKADADTKIDATTTASTEKLKEEIGSLLTSNDSPEEQEKKAKQVIDKITEEQRTALLNDAKHVVQNKKEASGKSKESMTMEANATTKSVNMEKTVTTKKAPEPILPVPDKALAESQALAFQEACLGVIAKEDGSKHFVACPKQPDGTCPATFDSSKCVLLKPVGSSLMKGASLLKF